MASDTDTDSSSRGRESVCLSSQCGLCQFALLQGELIMAIPGDGQPTAPMKCLFLTCLPDAESGVDYQVCHAFCSHDDGWAQACHVNCFRLVGARFRECLEVNVYSFQPTAYQQKGRRQWLLGNLLRSWEDDRTHATKNIRHLPPELREDIAEQLLREYATVILGALHPVDKARHIEFSISSDVWARFALVEGVKYVTSLSNTPSSDAIRILALKSQKYAIDTLYLCEDHLGVLQVVLSNGNKTQNTTQRPGVWWRSAKIPESIRLLQGHVDVSFTSDKIYT